MYIPTTTLNQQLTAGIDGWVDDSANAWTWVTTAPDAFTTAGDRTVAFSKGTRIKLTQTTVKYFVVVSSSFGAGVTTVTITAGTDYTLANAAISANFYSYAVNPQGYPATFAYSAGYTGWSSISSSLAAFRVVGNQCIVSSFATGTSNSTGITFTAPILSVNTVDAAASATNNGAETTTPAKLQLPFNSTAVTVFRDYAAATWTGSGTKTFNCTWAFPF